MLAAWLALAWLVASPTCFPSTVQIRTDVVELAIADAAARVAAGDTADAVALLRQAVADRPDEVRLLAELAWLLAAGASDVPTDFKERKAAEGYAVRALRAEPQNPRALSALAWVRLKQQGAGEAGRLLDRAIESPAFASASPEVRGDVLYLSGRRWAEEVRAFENLVVLPRGFAVASPSCSALGFFCRNFARPEQFNEVLDRAPSLEGLVADERERMLADYRAAVELNPHNVAAFGKLLIALADDGDWDAFLSVAKHGVEENPEAADVYMLMGLGLHRSGRTAEAQVKFAKGLECMPLEERAAFADPLELMSKDDADAAVAGSALHWGGFVRAYWAQADPLYLTEANERWVEHLARVTYADHKFAVTGAETRGARTEPGLIYVRYGPPRRIWAVTRDRSKETDALQLMNALELASCLGAEGASRDCSQIEARGAKTLFGGGRWEFWSYVEDRPSMVFSRALGYSDLSFMPGSYSENYAEEIRVRLPSFHDPFALELDIPHQLVRFKGDDKQTVRVETYAAFPFSELVRGLTRLADVGLFFFDPTYTDSYRWQERVRVRRGPAVQLIQVSLPLGDYAYSLEAFSEVTNTAAIGRGSLTLTEYPDDMLALSDLLVAEAIRAKTEPVESREDLHVRGSADFVFEPGQSVGLYWETYGLAEEMGLAHYEVAISVLDARERSFPVRVLRSITGLFADNSGQQMDVRWKRDVALVGRDRTIDWVELGELPEGRYRVVVSVTDLVSGAESSTERVVLVDDPYDVP